MISIIGIEESKKEKKNSHNQHQDESTCKQQVDVSMVRGKVRPKIRQIQVAIFDTVC